MRFKSEIDILTVSRYNFKDDTGRQVVGAKITFIDGLNTAVLEENKKGITVQQASGDYSMFEIIRGVPARYICEFTVDNKKIKILSANMVRDSVVAK